MSPSDANTARSSLWWVAPLILLFSAIEPATHLWIAAAPPEGMIHTGLHTHDSAFYLRAMDMLSSDYFSPYASCKAAEGSHATAWFPMADHYLYAGIGRLARTMGIPLFHALGLANGLGMLLLLLAARFLFRTISPEKGDLALLLYALGGGLGGVLYLITGALGWHGNPEFTVLFQRFAHYELIEHGYLAPHLIASRLYYTLSLALSLSGLAVLIRTLRHGRQSAVEIPQEPQFQQARRRVPPPNSFGGAQRDKGDSCQESTAFSAVWIRLPRFWGMVLAALLLGLGTLVNLRVGPLTWCAAALYLVSRPNGRLPKVLVHAALLAIPVALAAWVDMRLLHRNPMLTESYARLMRNSLWLTPLLVARPFHALLWPSALLRHAARLPKWLSILAFGAAAYLAAFVALHLAYLAYYGNWLRLYDATAARNISDWALLGLLAGLAFGAFRARLMPRIESPSHQEDWVSLWFAIVLAVALSAWGDGWFLRFAPGRLTAVVGVPMALVTAFEWTRWRVRFPRFSRALLGCMVGCGTISVIVACLCFQGPLGQWPERGPFPNLHHEFMTETDARLLEHLEPGTRLLTPEQGEPFLGDVAALRPGVRVVFGVGVLVFGDQDMMDMRQVARTIYNAETTDAERRALAEEWCITHVLCPDTAPVDPATRAALDGTPWLRVVEEEGAGVLFRVEVGGESSP